MQFILYSDTLDTIRERLGAPEYSYYFVLKAYQKALVRLGSVKIVRDPSTEVDAIYDDCRSRGEACLFLSFTPPHRMPSGIRCPTVPVIAWEFSTIPNEQWNGDQRSDWRVPLLEAGGAIALSTHTARLIAEALGPEFMVAAVPAPVQPPKDRNPPPGPEPRSTQLALTGSILDTAVGLRIDSTAPTARPQARRAGKFRRAMRRAVNWAQRLRKVPVTGAKEPKKYVHLAGVVYTAVLNPDDGRKNVLDIVTAFCWAFRTVVDATLVLKLVNRDTSSFFNKLLPILYQLAPFDCRVVVIDAFLEDEEFDTLRSATTFYVNASTAEGLCMPLMEFMAAGVPAIAPTHTAMADYIDEHVAFTLRTSWEITVWPHDPRDLFRTMCNRLDWGSLREAYRASYALAKAAPVEYREMSERSMQRMRSFASLEVVEDQLGAFLPAFERNRSKDYRPVGPERS